MSTTTPPSPDPLSQSLDSLVREGTLSPDQATQLYNAAEARPPGGPGQVPVPSAGWPFHDRLRAAASAIGGALAFAAAFIGVQLSAGEFKWKVFLVMAGITVVLAIGAAAWYLALSAVPHSRWVTSVLGAFAIKTLGFTILAPWGDKDAVPYLVGLLMIGLGAAGYWYLRGAAFAFAAFVGGFIFVNKFAEFVINEGDGPLMYGLIMMVYGFAVAAAGWRFDCRHVTGMLGAAVVLYGFYVVATVGALAAVAVQAVSQLSAELGSDPTMGGSELSGLADVDDDLRVTFILTLLICVGLAALYAYSHYVGYLVLGAIGAVQVLDIALLGVAREHPLRWGTLFIGGVGGLLLVGALIDQARRSGFVLPTQLQRSPGGPPGSPGGPPPGGPGGPPPGGPPPGGPGGPPPGSPGGPPPGPAGEAPPAPPPSDPASPPDSDPASPPADPDGPSDQTDPPAEPPPAAPSR